MASIPGGEWNTSSIPRVVNDIFVTENTSPLGGNTVYLGTDSGLSIIQEKQGDEANGSVKYVTKDYATEEMVGDIRGSWSFDGATPLNDNSVKANNLTNNGGVDFATAGVRGKAASFDGTNYLSSTSTGFAFTDNFTLSAWVKPSTLNTVGYFGLKNTIFYRGNTYFSQGNYALQISDNNTLSFVKRGSGGEGLQFYDFPNTPSMTGVWSHIVLTISSGTAKLYVNGVLVESTPIASLEASDTHTLYLGTSVSSYPETMLNGLIDEPFITAEALDAATIKRMYDNGRAALTAGGTAKLGGSSNTVKSIGVIGNSLYVATDGGSADDGVITKLNVNSLVQQQVIDTASSFASQTIGTAFDPVAISVSDAGLAFVDGSNAYAQVGSAKSGGKGNGLSDDRITANAFATNGGNYSSSYRKLIVGSIGGLDILDINKAPSAPTLLSPANAAWVNSNTPTLSAQFSDPDIGERGKTNYRIATSAAGCLDASTLVSSGSSVATATESGATTWSPSSTIGADGTYYWCAQNDDTVEQSAWTAMGSFQKDATLPSGTIVINAGAAATNSGVVTLTLSATDNLSGMSQMQFSCDNSTYSVLENYGVSKDWNVTTGSGCALGDGTKTVWVKYTDIAGNLAAAVSDTIVLDTTTPDITAVTAGPGENTITTGRVAYWKMDESSGTTVADSSGTNTGTANGTTIADAKFGKGRSFNGTSDEISIPANASLHPLVYTMSSWIKLDSYPTNTNIGGVIFMNYMNLKGSIFYVSDTGKISVRPHDSVGNGDVKGGSVLSLHSWHHVTATYDGTNIKVYVDGVQDGSLVYTGYQDDPLISAEIGAWPGGLAVFPGSLDDVAIYNRALSAEEVAQLANTSLVSGTWFNNPAIGGDSLMSYGWTNPASVSGNEYYYAEDTSSGPSLSTDSGLVGWWSFNEGAGSTVYDRSGNGNNGTLNGGATWNASGKLGGAGTFDGVDGYSSIPNSLSLNVSNELSISTWVKFTNTSGYGFIVSKSAGGSSGGYELFKDNASGRLRFSACDLSGVCSGGYFDIATPSSYADGQWHYVTATAKTGDYAKIYIDTVLAVQSASVITQNIISNTTDVNIGKRAGNYSQRFNGSLDEVRIWNRALSATEIAQEYNKKMSTTPYLDAYTPTEGDRFMHVKPFTLAGTWGTERMFETKYDATITTPTLTVIANSTTSLTATGSNSSDANSGLPATPYYLERDNGTSFTTAQTNSGWTADAFTEATLTPNTAYTYRVKAKDNVDNISNWSTTVTRYTLAVVPQSPTLSAQTATTIHVTPRADAGSTNPAATTYAIQVVYNATTKYVQADGTLGDTAAWQTLSAWSTATVVGLDFATNTYTFKTKARNGDTVETALSAVATSFNTITLTSGNNQIGGMNETLSSELKVRVSDGATTYAGAGDVTVTFTIASAPVTPTPTYPSDSAFLAGTTGQNHSLTNTTTMTAQTDADGYASVRLNLGNRAGTYVVTATFTGNTSGAATFTAIEREFFTVTLDTTDLTIITDPANATTGTDTVTATVVTNAASYSLATVLNQLPTRSGGSETVPNWSTTGFGWHTTGTTTAFSGTNPSTPTVVYSCTSSCQGTQVVTVSLDLLVDYTILAGTYLNDFTLQGTEIGW